MDNKEIIALTYVSYRFYKTPVRIHVLLSLGKYKDSDTFFLKSASMNVLSVIYWNIHLVPKYDIKWILTHHSKLQLYVTFLVPTLENYLCDYLLGD